MNIEPTATSFDVQRFRRANVEWFGLMNFTYSITLAFNRADEMTPKRADEMVADAFGRVDCEILGSRFHRLPSHRRTSYLFVVEKPTTNFHLQGFARLGSDNWFNNGHPCRENIHARFVRELVETWRAISSSGSCKVNPMHSDARQYAAKGLYPDVPPDRFIVSPHLTAIGRGDSR